MAYLHDALELGPTVPHLLPLSHAHTGVEPALSLPG
jgi:hypothetical protein